MSARLLQIHHSTWECGSPEQATAASSTIEYANATRDYLPHHIPVTAARFRGGQGEIHCFQQFCKCTERCNMYREVAQMCSQTRSACHNSGLSMENSHEGCILWGSRVVVPLAGCKQQLQELHAVHQGMARMKGLACSSFWLLKFDANLWDNVSKHEESHCQHYCIHGVGQAVHGPEFAWIMLVLLGTISFWC